MNRPDTSVLDHWTKPQALEDAAKALRADGKKYSRTADRVVPVWYDLSEYFRLYTTQDMYIYYAGRAVADYGEAVQKGAESMAKCLEDCAGFIQLYDNERQDIFKRAAAARTQLADNPAPELNPDGSMPEDFVGDQVLHDSANQAVMALEREIAELASKYRNLMASTATEISGIHDNGSGPHTLWDMTLGAALIGATFVPPVATAAGVLSAGAAIASEYQSRTKALKEEHPELSDSEISADGKVHTLKSLPAVLAAPVGAGKAAARLVELRGGSPGLQTGMEAGVTLGVGAMTSTPTTGDPKPGSPARKAVFHPRSAIPAQPVGPLSPAELVKRARAQANLNDPERILETKDYDRDGYTDAPFRPGPPRLVTIPNTDISRMKAPEAPPERLVLPTHQDPFKAVTDD